MTIHELELAVQALGRETLGREPEWSAERLGEFYAGGIEAFGPDGPDEEELLEARLWFVLDCPLPEGQTPLWRRRQEADGRAVELLARSELRAWRIESVAGDTTLTALCPLGTGRVRLELARPAVGSLRPGAMIVARSVPVGPERWALLGRVPVVDPAAAADFELLLASLDAPRGEFWHVHGGVLSNAAWAWPTIHHRTREGSPVQPSRSTWPVLDTGHVRAVLDSDPELIGGDRPGTWRWRWDPPAPRNRSPEPGVVVEPCSQDRGSEPCLATIALDYARSELECLAATPERLALAQPLLGERLIGLVRAATPVRTEPAVLTPRWKSLRRSEARSSQAA